MPTVNAAQDNICIARQPILDRRGEVFAYELLYRDHYRADSCTSRGDSASSRVLSDALLTFGLSELTGKRPAFVNFTRELLLSGAATLASPASLVIEILEDMTIDKAVVETCKDLHGRGYAIGLDDYTPDGPAEALIPYAKFIKVDVLLTTTAQRAQLVERFRPLGVSMIAEKVETAEMAAAVRESGYHLVQGYYFCKPTTFSKTPLPGRQLASIQLLGALNREDVSTQQLETLIKREPTLTFQLLRSVNSAASGVRREIASVQQALVLLGREKVRKWATVWTLTQTNTVGTRETVAVALLRARCCELLGEARAESAGGSGFFLLGLCSLLDVIVGRPMAMVIEDLPLSSTIAEALLGGRNTPRLTLDAVISYEQGDWDGAAAHMATLGIPFDALASAYGDALRWANELSQLE